MCLDTLKVIQLVDDHFFLDHAFLRAERCRVAAEPERRDPWGGGAAGSVIGDIFFAGRITRAHARKKDR